MSSIRNELEKLNSTDIWSLMLFVLYKVKGIPEYTSLSELAYILDKKNLLKLCEYYGGSTITIPTIDELEVLLYGLLVYQYVDVEKLTYTSAIDLISNSSIDKRRIKTAYNKIREVVNNYSFQTRKV